MRRRGLLLGLMLLRATNSEVNELFLPANGEGSLPHCSSDASNSAVNQRTERRTSRLLAGALMGSGARLVRAADVRLTRGRRLVYTFRYFKRFVASNHTRFALIQLGRPGIRTAHVQNRTSCVYVYVKLI